MRKKNFKIIVTLVIVVLLGVMLVACGDKKVEGKYKATISYSDISKDLIQNEVSGFDLDFLDDMDLSMDVSLELNEDETYFMEMDYAGAVDNMMQEFEKNGEKIIGAILESQGLSSDLFDLDSLAAISGYDSKDDMISDMLDEMKKSMEEATGNEDVLKSEGTYTVENDKITLETQGDPIEGTIKNGAITFTMDYEGTPIEMVFKK